MDTLFKKSDWIKDKDHTRVSGIEPLIIILNQTKWWRRLKCDAKIMPKCIELKRDGVTNHKPSFQFLTQTIWEQRWCSG